MLAVRAGFGENSRRKSETGLRMSLLAIGLNHSTAPVEVRERVAFAADMLPTALGDLREQAGAEEAVILSTCNRTEIYCTVAQHDCHRPMEWFLDFHGCRAGLEPYLYTHPDADAVKHVLRVASGLDSMVLGEPQVLGQMKGAYHAAVRAGMTGRLLDRLFQHSFRVAKVIRSNTAIGNHPVSIAFAAVRLAQQIFGDLGAHTALLIGAGETMELTARHLAESGLRRMIVANRTLEHSQRLASEYSGYAIALDRLPDHLYEADIIVSATSSPAPILLRADIEQALARRRNRPVFIVDIAVPRDIDPAAGELEDVYLYTVDDLRGVIDENLRNRREAARQAEEIIDTQVVNFMEWIRARDAITTIRAMRDKAGDIRREVLAAAKRRLENGEDPERVLEDVSRVLTNKLIHSPSAQLRLAGAHGREDLLRAARELFNLPADPADPEKPG
jgi:glutamyl-tRNA reductase